MEITVVMLPKQKSLIFRQNENILVFMRQNAIVYRQFLRAFKLIALSGSIWIRVL